MLGIAEKWRPSWFFGVVGCEYTHTSTVHKAFSLLCEPFDFWRGSEESFKTARWYASWILLLALLLPLLLHSMWLGLTLSGSIQDDANFSVKYRRLEDSTI
jgi:hypothetical protein